MGQKELELKDFYLYKNATVREDSDCVENSNKNRRFQAIRLHNTEFYKLKCQLN